MRVLFAVFLFAMTGCLQPDIATGPGQNVDKAHIEDQNLLAGATSSTNWPTEEGGETTISVRGKSDSGITLFFIKVVARAKVSGTVSLFPAGYIPSFDTIPRVDQTFHESDSFVVSPGQIENLEFEAPDSVYFSIGVEVDTGSTFITGFLYSKKQKRLLKSPFSVLNVNPYLLRRVRFGFSGNPDSLLSKTINEAKGKFDLCFYIPGSPYFWRGLIGDTLLAPVPSGVFPIRLLKVSQGSGSEGSVEIEAFEISFVKVFHASNRTESWEFHLGARIFSSTVLGRPSIRAPSP